MAAYNPSLYNLNVGLHFKKDNLMAKASYSLDLGDRFVSSASPQLNNIHVVSINGNSRSTVINAELCYLIKTNSEKKDITVKLKSSGKVDYVTKINITEKTSYGLRAGYKMGSTWYALTNKLEITVTDIYGMPKVLSNTQSSTMMQYAMARIGVNRVKSTNAVAKISNYGLRNHSFLNE